MKKAQKVLNYVRKNIEYVTDEEQYKVKEHWPVSSQVFETMKDDCDGQSIAMWSKLRDAGFPDDNIGMVVLRIDDQLKTTFHMICCVYEDKFDNDFWILDNGSISYCMTKASEIFSIKNNNKSFTPLFGFNLFECWSY